MNRGRRGELVEFGRKTEAEAIRDDLDRHPDGKFGFTVYRVEYGNDADFAVFIDRLTAHAHAKLDDDDTGDQIKDLLQWDIRDDATELDGVSLERVRGSVSVPLTCQILADFSDQAV
jgi:hypothetical protein